MKLSICVLFRTVDGRVTLPGGGAMLLGTPNGAATVVGPEVVEETYEEADADTRVRAVTTSKNIQTSYQTCSSEYAINSASL